jgi:hypothetical protein
VPNAGLADTPRQDESMNPFGEPLKGRVENVTEWWGALIFVLGFCALALMWRRERAVLSLGVSPR